jgi:hypothetical protein
MVTLVVQQWAHFAWQAGFWAALYAATAFPLYNFKFFPY